MRIAKTLATLCAALMAVAFAAPSLAQEEVIDLGEIVVQAPELTAAEQLKQQPGTTTIIERRDFEDKFTSVPELLEKTVGVETRSFGGLGSFSMVSIRGASANQTLVLLDGIPLNEAYGGAVNLGNIPLQNVERIEVFRGNTPVRFGDSALGGVVNIVTRGPSEKPLVKTSAGIGSFGTHFEGIFTSQKKDMWNNAASAVFQGSGGNFKYLNDNGTPFNAADDMMVRRENNANKALTLNWKGDREGGPSHRLKINTNYFHKREGVPGLGSNQSATARLRTDRMLGDARWERDNFLAKNSSLAFEIENSNLRQDFYDPLNEIGVGKEISRTYIRRNAARMELTMLPLRNHTATLITEIARENYSPYDYLSSQPVGRNSRRTSFFAAAEDKVSLINGRLLLTPSVRWQAFRSGFSGSDPFAPAVQGTVSDRLAGGYFGAKYRLNDALVARFNGGRYNRLPGLYELFGDRGNIIGNPSLAPEEGNNYDLGISADLGKVAMRPGLFELTGFQSEVKNLITFIQNSQHTARPTNIGRAKIHGLEASFQIELHPRWTFAANYTWTHAVDDSSVAFWRGNNLPGIHENMFNLRLQESIGHGDSWYYEWSREGGNYLDRANLNHMPARDITNIGITFRPRNVTTTFEVKNLGNNQIADLVGFPLPGRSFYMTVSRETR